MNDAIEWLKKLGEEWETIRLYSYEFNSGRSWFLEVSIEDSKHGTIEHEVESDTPEGAIKKMIEKLAVS